MTGFGFVVSESSDDVVGDCSAEEIWWSNGGGLPLGLCCVCGGVLGGVGRVRIFEDGCGMVCGGGAGGWAWWLFFGMGWMVCGMVGCVVILCVLGGGVGGTGEDGCVFGDEWIVLWICRNLRACSLGQ